MLDVVIVSDGKAPSLVELTQQTIDTCMDGGVPMTVYVVESEKVKYKDANMIYPSVDFNYNRYLNAGARQGKNPYIAFCNNDLIFEKGWAKTVIDKMDEFSCATGSPHCPKAHILGYKMKGDVMGLETRKTFPGWCFVMRRDIYDTLGGLDESYTYWCSDNVVVEQLKEIHATHVLCIDAVCEHIGDKTGNTLDRETKVDYTWGQAKKFEEDYDQELFPQARYDKNLCKSI